ncbi:Gx transporter family protein [Tissierella creatinophila]|uniref:Heptaprenyl diphosphate synthase component I n=1 Tax=Tissierella creatinophila DSM 6911 TaxID=1123403 RepID=A0A1U7M7T9_TISCR|nr:Gx transporter family protein [Tissierella creatinophila]OLS03320.1 heptaprenyl diphosphate synthase component I [Tissierella creatinophila DSM 6911]
MKRLNKSIFLSILVSIGLALSILESSIPLPITIPGARLGLSNMVVLITLIMFGFREGLVVSSLKSIVLMLITGSISSFIYSFSGAIISCIGMYVVYEYFSRVFSLIGVSIFGALFHNFAQVTIASFMMNNMRIYTYLPFLMITSIFTGYFVGLSSTFIIKNLKKVLIFY